MRKIIVGVLLTLMASVLVACTPKTFEVTFDTNGGTNVAAVEVESGAVVTQPADPTKEGYVFADWYTDSALTASYDFSSEVTEDFMLYAKWTELEVGTFLVSFDADGGSYVNGIVIEEDAMVPEPADPTKEGYNFVAWNLNDTAFDFETPITANITLVAEWAVATPGITDTEIIIGNTAATSGVFAGVGIPFNLAMQVVFDEYNATHDGRDINFIHYDDGFDGEQGLAYTKTLVEEDEVFALVGHFGTNTVNATMDYLLDSGVPMVYGVTGVNSLFFEDVPGNNILSVQPIYRTEGRMMVARALNESLFGATEDQPLGASDEIVVLYSDDDAGQSIRQGIQDEVTSEEISDRVTYLPFSTSTASAVAQVALDANPGVILMSANQAPATAMATALRILNSDVPVLSSYVNSAAVFIPAMVDATTPLPYAVYANAWVDIADATGVAPTETQVGTATMIGWNELESDPLYGSDYAFLAGYTSEYWETFVYDMNTSSLVDGDTVARALWANPYAMAGYVAATTFVSILERVDLDTVTWESFIAAAESAPIDLPMAGLIDWSDGARTGLEVLALNKLNYGSTTSFIKVRPLASLDQVRG